MEGKLPEKWATSRFLLAEGSLDLLSELRCPRKMLVHINNTNPLLDETGPEYRQVRERGWEIVEDGCHLDL